MKATRPFMRIYRLRSGKPELLLGSETETDPHVWTPDGQTLLYT